MKEDFKILLLSDVDECGPLVSTRCDDDEICLARGVGGRFICVERM